jgi:16S rRNA processing protein RimM
MGRIAAPYGVRGWLKVQPWSEDPSTLLAHTVWWLRAPDGSGPWREAEVVNARPHGAGLVAELRGVSTREAALALRGCQIGLPRAVLEALGVDEHYWADLEGMAVVNRDGVPLGRVEEVAASGAHPILRVVDESRIERLIPFVAAYIDRVDATAGRIDVDWQPDY